MTRDFSLEAKQQLLLLAQQITDGNQSKELNLCDTNSDGVIDINDYIGELEKFHALIIEKNNTTIQNINSIFSSVNMVSNQYTSRFVALIAKVKTFEKCVKAITNAMKVSDDYQGVDFDAQEIKSLIQKYLEPNDYLTEIIADGLSVDEILESEECERRLRELLDTFKPIMLDNILGIGVGGEFVMPIGPGVEVYYSISRNGTDDSGIDIESVIDRQKEEIKGYNFQYELDQTLKVGLDYLGNINVEVCGRDIPTIAVATNGIFLSYEEKEEDYAYSYMYGVDFIEAEVVIEEAVSYTENDAEVELAVGIRMSAINYYKNLPQSEPIVAPILCTIPEYDADWQMIEPVDEELVLTYGLLMVLLMLWNPSLAVVVAI